MKNDHKHEISGDCSLQATGEHIDTLTAIFGALHPYLMRKSFEAFLVKENRLWLYVFADTGCGTPKEASKFPAPMLPEGCVEMVFRFIQGNAPTGTIPDFDGDVERGFKITACEGEVSIEPIHILYGK